MTTTTQPVTLEILEGPDWRAQDDDGRDWEHHAYTVRLVRGSQSMIVPWRAGIGITDDPTAADVLEALLSDAAGAVNARSFEEWAADYGYDTDSRSAERTFRAVEEQTEKLRALLGDDFDAAVFPTGDHDDPNRAAALRLAGDDE